jgi:hypothetical protein
MTAMDKKKTKMKSKSNLRLKTALMLLQILLPFGLYTAMQLEASLAVVLIASGFVLSMGGLVWLG